MRELHVVAVSDDGRHVVLATRPDAAKGTFRVALDARLRAALQGSAQPAPQPAKGPAQRPAPAEPSALSVREIQARLRAGESAEQIAASAGVAVERVERFAGPVRSEQEKVVEAARATPLLHSRRGLSVLPLGEAVDLHFSQIDSLKPESVAWSARREEAGTWVVEVSYVARARTRSGSWRYDPAERTVVAVDTVSASLGHSDTLDSAPAGPTRRQGRSRTSGPSGRGARAAKPPARSVVPATVSAAAPAAPARPDRRRARKQPSSPPQAPAAVRAAAGTRAPPVVAAPGRQAGAPRTARRSPAAPAAARPPAPTLRVVPALDQQPRPPQPPRPGGSGRASVPAWADVLLSTSARPEDRASGRGEASSD